MTEPRILVTRRARRDLESLDRPTKQRIIRKLGQIGSLPVRGAKPLRDSRLGDYRLRIGDYRVVFDVEGTDVVILRVGHRKEIYRG